MIRIYSNSWARWWVVAVTILSWFVLSNHCALGGMQSVSQHSMQGCCGNAGHPSDEDGAPDVPLIICCKSVRAVVQHAAVLPDCPVSPFLNPVFVFEAIVETDSHDVSVSLSGEGPPDGAATLAELLVEKSLLSHAPPSAS